MSTAMLARPGLFLIILWGVSCSQDESSFELECQGSEITHTQTERDGELTTEDSSLEVKRHFTLIQRELNSVMCDQWDERQIHCLIEDHPKSKSKDVKKSYVEDFMLNRREMNVTVSIQKNSQSEHLKIKTTSDFTGGCQSFALRTKSR